MSIDTLRAEIKSLVITTMKLDGMTPEQIGDEQALFGEGLGLDSLAALELVVELEYRYGFEYRLDSEAAREVFRNVSTLAEFVAAQRSK